MEKRQAHMCFFLIFTLLVAGCSNGSSTHIFYPGFETSLPIIEAVEYPSFRGKNNNKPYEVKIYLANLFYGKKYNSDEIEHLHSYSNLQSIDVFLESNNKVLLTYSVDLKEYSKQENGIIANNANKATINDFKLMYPFDLQELFVTNCYNQNVTFVIRYAEKTIDSFLERGKTISFLLNKNSTSIEISNFEYDYFAWLLGFSNF